MEPDTKNTSSGGLEHLDKKLKRLWVSYAAIQIFSICIILLTIEFISHRGKSMLANAITDSISNAVVIKDYRKISEILSVSSRNDFSRVVVFDYSGDQEIQIKNKDSVRFLSKISIPIYFDAKSKNQIGEAQFEYASFSSLYQVFGVWFILFLISGAWIYRFRKNIIRDFKIESEIVFARKITDISRKVAHDIRSPLSALNMLIGNLSEMSEQERSILIQVSERINSIADELLSKSPNFSTEDVGRQMLYKEKNLAKTCNLKSVLKEILEEKSLEYKQRSEINFVLENTNFPENIRANIPEQTLKRIISNLLNNSVDAITTNGNIYVEISLRKNVVMITITDFGCGIPESVLERFKESDYGSYGKQKGNKSGSGIGLLAAYKELKTYGGALQIESKVKVGTKISLTLNSIDNLTPTPPTHSQS